MYKNCEFKIYYITNKLDVGNGTMFGDIAIVKIAKTSL